MAPDTRARTVFQIDGNLGAIAAIGEMLLQSHGERIKLLPALRTSWRSGRISGLRARSGFEIGIQWRDSKLVEARVTSAKGAVCRLQMKIHVDVFNGQRRIETDADPQTVAFATTPGEIHRIVPSGG